MPGGETHIIALALAASAVAGVVGFAAFWANPQRRVNQAVFSTSLHVVLWLLCRTMAGHASDGLLWMRITTAVGAFLPLQFWLLFDSIVRPNANFRNVFRRLIPWIVTAGLLAAIVFTQWFIPRESTPEARLFGVGYILHFVGLLTCYLVLIARTALAVRQHTGIARVELKVVLLGGASAAVVVIFLMVLQRVFRVSIPQELQLLIVLAQFLLMIGAITTHRIFEARYLVILCAQRVLLVVVVAGIAYVVDYLTRLVLSPPLAFLMAVATALAVASQVNGGLDRLLRRDVVVSEARLEAFATARRSLRLEQLEQEFLRILAGWAKAESGLILVHSDGHFEGNGHLWEDSQFALNALSELGWATPERLSRERATPARVALAKLLAEQKLGAVVYCAGPILGIVAGVAVRSSRRPYTYPDVVRLQELGSIIETAYSRSHLTAKVQRAEQLATVGLLGASVAHEIRNPLVTIKAFVQLLPQHYSDDTFRERFSRLIGSEVARIDRLTEQLLDLATPHSYQATPQPLHAVLLSSLELVKAKAGECNTQLITALDANPDWVLIDPNAAKQVVLNLCFNAIQAQENQPGDRWVRITTRNVERGVEMCVADNGPGISADVRPRLFEAFQSTKSSGFGLGLAVCSEILTSLGATISVDPYISGQGAVFRVVFSCPPPTS